MTSEEFANEVQSIIESVRFRIEGVGAEQYQTQSDVQRFESRSLQDILQDAREEIDDLIVYGAQLRIRLDALQERLIAFDKIERGH